MTEAPGPQSSTPPTPEQLKRAVEQGPPLLGAPITLEQARQEIGRLIGLPVSIVSIRFACRRYRKRISGRAYTALDSDPIDLTKAASASWEPFAEHGEIKCIWPGSAAGIIGRTYLVDDYPANLQGLANYLDPTKQQGKGNRVSLTSRPSRLRPPSTHATRSTRPGQHSKKPKNKQ